MTALSFADSASVSSGSFCDTESSVSGLPEYTAEAETTQTGQVKEVEQMALQETKNMRRWKFVVVLTIVTTASLVSAGTYIFLKQNEDSNFDDSFMSFANTIEDAVDVHKHNLFSTMQGFSNSVTSSAMATTSTFPFVTVKTFEVLGSNVRRQSGAEILLYVPKVEEDQVGRFNTYTAVNSGWYEESKDLMIASGEGTLQYSDFADGFILPDIFDVAADDAGNVIPLPSQNPPFYPIWQTSPPPFSPFAIKTNVASRPNVITGLQATEILREGVIGPVLDLTNDPVAQVGIKLDDHEFYHSQFVSSDGPNSALARPHGVLYEPIFEQIYNTSSDIVGYVAAVIAWDRYVADLLPEGIRGITAVLENTCNQVHTYYIDGNRAFYAGIGDLHDQRYNDMKLEIPFTAYDKESTKDVPGQCVYTFLIYPTKEFEDEYRSNLPLVMTSVVTATFFFMIVTFGVYDWFVRRRNHKVVGAAARSNAILASMFPKNIRERLFAEKVIEEEQQEQKRAFIEPGTKSRLKTFLKNGSDAIDVQVDDDDDFMYKSRPIADLFPETTILFADISGFTAWSSAREPTQVFMLLETLYRAFDKIAKRRRVFKVETIGDCYVAVTGLPDPRKDHAVAMARFARDCMYKMHDLTRRLEVTLGPDTAELSMRFGLHSGPVTAGVLRGERSRFQLFGDTMNTASRMESTGLRDRIQVSQETADLLIEAGKSKWIMARQDKVIAKGKGEMQTYWVAVGSAKSYGGTEGTELSGEGSVYDSTHELDYPEVTAKTSRLIKWNVDVLANLLKRVEARRNVETTVASGLTVAAVVGFDGEPHTVLDEVQEIIDLPTYEGNASALSCEGELGQQVLDQLEEYVSTVASMYRDNPFHNFEHASHVTMSVVKLLSRIVAPDLGRMSGEDRASTLHDHTYGITSDPLTQFACVLSALIHDVDHSGVPNNQLIKENSVLASVYKNKSVAEQNSVDLSWDLLMDERFDGLRAAIYRTDAERRRFRQLIVNSVIATDIMDKDLKLLRNSRWSKAFAGSQRKDSKKVAADRKATIVIEHLIQASDVAHTMQHWHIYRKWNARLFQEMYKAYIDGRADQDPSESWYTGEMGFYDFYIIPLARKLKDCGVFGVSSDEYLNNALKNRKEWEERGEEVVAELVEEVRANATRCII